MSITGANSSVSNFYSHEPTEAPKMDTEKVVKSDTKKVFNNIAKKKDELHLQKDILVKNTANSSQKIIHKLSFIKNNKLLNTKYKVIIGDSNVKKSSFDYGESKIDFRFKTDIKKSVFSPPKTDTKEYGKNKDFFYVNGIMTDKKSAENTAAELSKLTGQKVEPIYNKTNGILKDLWEVGVERLSNSSFDDVTKATANSFFETLKSGKELKVIAHSQGAAITADAMVLCRKMLIEHEYLKYASPGIVPSIPDMPKYQSSITGIVPYDKNMPSDAEIRKKVSEIMGKIEIITMGGASSQDKFPNEVKLVQITNPKDPVPQVGGTDLLQTKFIRSEVTSGKISYVSNSEKINTGKISHYNKAIQHSVSGYYGVIAGIRNAISEGISGKNIIDYHSVDDKKNRDSYLNQNNVKSLIYNFGRQDFQ